MTDRLWQYPALAEPVLSEPEVPEAGWLPYPPEPIHRLPRHRTAGASYVPELEDVIPDIDWLRPADEPQRRPARLRLGEFVLVEAPAVPAVPDIGWLRESENPKIGRARRRYGEFAYVGEPIAPPAEPDIGWLVERPEPIHRPPRRPAPEPTIVVDPELYRPAYDWLPYPPEPFHRRPRRQTAGGVLDPFPRPPEPALLEWWRPTDEPVRRPRRVPITDFILRIVVTPTGPVVVVILTGCMALWQIVDPATWPSAVDPSGFQRDPDTAPDPSGFIREPDGTNLWEMF